MSVVMRRKAHTLKLSHKNNSNYKLGFSLNNTRRFVYHRNQIQTPFRGNVPRGHGGTYTGNIIKCQTFCSDTNNVSVKNNRGMMSTKYKWINRGYPYTVVKNVGSSSSSYDNYLQKKKGNITKKAIPVTCTQSNSTNMTNINATNKTNSHIVKNIGPVSYDTYLNSLKGNITKTTYPISFPDINYNCLNVNE